MVLITQVCIFRGTIKGTYHVLKEQGSCVQAQRSDPR